MPCRSGWFGSRGVWRCVVRRLRGAEHTFRLVRRRLFGHNSINHVAGILDHLGIIVDLLIEMLGVHVIRVVLDLRFGLRCWHFLGITVALVSKELLI